MCRPDGRHVLNNQGTDDYVLTEYARLYLDSEMQDWVNAMNMEWYST